MDNLELKLSIYDKEQYDKICKFFLKKDSCKNYYDDEDKILFKELLKLSNYNCFYCGESLISNTNKGVEFEKEHIINKTIDKEKNYALYRCGKNLIPICRTCNAQKLVIPMNSEFKKKLKRLERNCKSKTENKVETCEIEECLKLLIENHFNPFSQDVKYSILKNHFEGDLDYINMFSLNKRNNMLLERLNETLFGTKASFKQKNYIKYLKELFPSALEKEYIDLLKDFNLIDEKGTVNKKKLNNFIKTQYLLKFIY